MNWRKAVVMLAIGGAVLSVPAGASAAVLGTYQPSPADLNDLDHHKLYTWRIQDAALSGKTVTVATLKFTNMYNWDNSGNVLYLWLLTNVANAGTTSWTDDSATIPTLAASVNNFNKNSSLPVPTWLVSTADLATARNMSNRSFAGPAATSTPFTSPGPANAAAVPGWTYSGSGPYNYTYTYTFSAGDLATLNAFLTDSSANTFALGLDPDCHFFNSGVTLELQGNNTVQAVPEPATWLLIGTGMAFLARRRVIRKSPR